MSATLLASIPSPGSGSLELGPFSIHLYGLTLLVAIVVCMWITGRRWVARGGDWDLIFRCAVWGVAAGIVGARLYHVITSWDEVPDEWWGAFAIWKGGLGVWGGILAGCVVGGIIAKRAGADVWLLADCLAPGLLVAQAIGRLGNWWNQELFGRPTDLPWGLEIDPEQPAARVDRRPDVPPDLPLRAPLEPLAAAPSSCSCSSDASGHDRRASSRAYVALYCFGRFWIELLRVDPAHEHPGPTPQRLGLGIGVRRRRRLVRPLATTRRGADSAQSPAVAPTQAKARQATGDGRAEGPRPARQLGSPVWGSPSAISSWTSTRSKGPFDLLLTLVLKDQLQPAEIDIAGIVVAFVERLAERDELDLDACGEFLVLIAALLELKARHLFPDEEAELADLEPEEAAEELARRLAEYRRMKEAAAWLRERLVAERDRYFRVGPAPLAPQLERRLAAQDPAASSPRCEGWRSSRRRCPSRTWRSASRP